MRKTKLALLALTAALAVTACGGKKEEKKPETVSAAETQVTEATEATTLAPATDEEKAKAAEVGKKIMSRIGARTRRSSAKRQRRLGTL